MSGCVLQAWPFVHPSFAAVAVSAAALPILIHLLNRRRYRRMPWAAMRFLQAAKRRSARRIWLDHFLLLLIRIAVLVLFVMALARPFLASSPLGMLGRARAHHVLLIDNSCSMSAVDGGGSAVGGESRFDRAFGIVNELVDSFPTGDAVSVVTLASPATPLISHAAYDRRQVRDKLRQVRLTQRATDVAGALAAALDILKASEAPPSNRVVYIISDTPASIWTHGEHRAVIESARLIAADAELVFVHVGSPNAANVAITDIRGTRVAAGAELPTRIVVQIDNHSDQVVRGCTVQISLDDTIIRKIPISRMEPRSTTEVALSAAINDPGSHVISARIDPIAQDVFAVDNERRLAVDVAPAFSVLLVDGHPGPTALTGQAGYLATALAPKPDADDLDSTTPKREQAFSCRIIGYRDLATEPLADHAVVALCNVQRLAPDQWQRLARFVARGGGLMVFAGDRLDAENYNRQGYQDGRGVLPCRIGPVIGEVESPERFVRFAHDAFTHPAMADFADNAESGLFAARISRFLSVEPEESRASVLLRYAVENSELTRGSAGPPAIVVRPFEHGQVCFVTTSADMSWNNLPAKGDYVSLMINLVTFVGRAEASSRTHLVGSQISETLAPSETSAALWVTQPDGRVTDARLVFDAGQASLRFGPVEHAGIYAASVGTRAVKFAVNIDPSESDLRTVDRDTLADVLKTRFRFIEADREGLSAVAQAASNEIAIPLLALTLVLMLAESFWATRAGRAR